MPTLARSYATAGAALIGAGVLSTIPITSLAPESRQARLDMDLVAVVQRCTDSAAPALCSPSPGPQSATTFTPAANITNMFNIPANLFIALANTPFNLFNALGSGDVALGSESDGGPNFQPTYEGITLTQPAGNVVGLGANLNYGGSWWVYSPTNILGTDSADVPRYQALTNVLIPFPALSVPLGNILAAAAASQLPMNSGCTGTGPGSCDDPNAILSKMFDFSHVGALFSPQGYTFPSVREGISCSEDGQCYVKDPEGSELPWSGQTVKLDLSAPFTSVYASLTETPDFSSVQPVTPEFATASLASLGRGLNTAYNPIVPGTQCAICAPLVPNPDGDPVPGPVFEDPGTADAPTQTVAVEARAAESAYPIEDLDEPAGAARPDNDVEPLSAEPKHRSTSAFGETMNRVRDKVNASISKISDGFATSGFKNSESTRSSSSATNIGESSADSKKSGTEPGSGSGG